MNINLHIERLILDGVDVAPSQRDLLQASVTTELIRLLNNGGLADTFVKGEAFSRLPADSIQLTGSNPTQLGKQIAQSVYGGLGSE